MGLKEHQKRHKILCDALDELVADFIIHADRLPDRATISYLMEWTKKQIENPTPGFEVEHHNL